MNMQGLKANLKFHWMNLGYSMLVFWVIMSLVMMFSVLINAMTAVSIGLFVSVTREGTTQAVSVVAAGFIAIVIYMIVVSLASQPENFSFLIGLGTSRRTFYAAQVVVLILVAFANSLIHALAFALESSILPMFGLQQLDYLEVYGLNLNLATLTLAQWMILTTVSAALMVVAALFYRYKSRNAIIVFVTLATAGVILPVTFGINIWGYFFRWLFANATVWELSGKLLLVSAVFWIIGWLIIRRTEAR